MIISVLGMNGGAMLFQMLAVSKNQQVSYITPSFSACGQLTPKDSVKINVRQGKGVLRIILVRKSRTFFQRASDLFRIR